MCRARQATGLTAPRSRPAPRHAQASCATAELLPPEHGQCGVGGRVLTTDRCRAAVASGGSGDAFVADPDTGHRRADAPPPPRLGLGWPDRRHTRRSTHPCQRSAYRIASGTRTFTLSGQFSPAQLGLHILGSRPADQIGQMERISPKAPRQQAATTVDGHVLRSATISILAAMCILRRSPGGHYRSPHLRRGLPIRVGGKQCSPVKAAHGGPRSLGQCRRRPGTAPWRGICAYAPPRA